MLFDDQISILTQNVGFIFDHIISTLRMPTHMVGMVEVDIKAKYYVTQLILAKIINSTSL